MISLEKLKIWTPLQKLPKNVAILGKLIVAKGFEKLPQSPINRSIWSYWWWEREQRKQLSSCWCEIDKDFWHCVWLREGVCEIDCVEIVSLS